MLSFGEAEARETPLLSIYIGDKNE